MIAEGTILTIIRTIGGAIYPPLRKKYFDQPKIYISIDKSGNSRKMNLGLSINNEIKKEIIDNKEVEFYDGNNAVRFFQMDWDYKLSLRNNSEYTAYHLKLLKPNSSNDCILEPKIDFLKPIIQNSSEYFTLKFSVIFEGTGEESVSVFNKGTNYFEKFKVVLEYTNLKGTKFYTTYDFNKPEEDLNSFHRKNPIS